MALHEDEIRAAEWDCQAVLNAFFRRLDAREYKALVELWHPDGFWERPGERLPTSQIESSLEPRGKTAVRHHIMTSAIFEVHDRERTSFSCYIVSLTGDTGEPPKGSIPPKSFKVFVCNGELRATEAGWRISRYTHDLPSLALEVPAIPKAAA